MRRSAETWEKIQLMDFDVNEHISSENKNIFL